MPNGQRYTKHNRAAKRAAWQVVREHCPAKAEAQCREIIRQWCESQGAVRGSLRRSDQPQTKAWFARRRQQASAVLNRKGVIAMGAVKELLEQMCNTARQTAGSTPIAGGSRPAAVLA